MNRITLDTGVEMSNMSLTTYQYFMYIPAKSSPSPKEAI